MALISLDTRKKGEAMNIGLVLSGGFAKGAYQLGALYAIKEFVPVEDIKCISSASIGTPNAYAFATDKLEKIEGMWHNFVDTNTRMFITKILQSSLLQQDIRSLYDPSDKLENPFYVSLWDVASISDSASCYKDLSKVPSEDITDYLRASISFPIYNKAIEIGESRYFDGGFVDNIPVYPLVEHDLDYIICVYFDDISYRFENSQFDDRIIKITFPNMSNIKNSFIITQEEIDKMIEEGYERTMHILRSIFANGYDDLDHVYKSIIYHNKQLGDPKLRLTTDVVITNVNKLLSRFAKRKNIL